MAMAAMAARVILRNIQVLLPGMIARHAFETRPAQAKFERFL
jgi:hypothetical protein